MNRYIRNMQCLSAEENDKLKDFRVCVVGCGGLGGYIIEMLGRLGIGYITAVDGDVFEESNLNRQILSDIDSIGKSKANKAMERMRTVNPLITVNPVYERLSDNNCSNILSGHNVIIDALDNIESRLLLEEFAEKLRIPLVHGAIAGWYGQVTTVLPGDSTLTKLYGNKNAENPMGYLGNPSFSPAMVASIEVSEVVKVLINRGEILSKKVLFIDLLRNEFQTVNL